MSRKLILITVSISALLSWWIITIFSQFLDNRLPSINVVTRVLDSSMLYPGGHADVEVSLSYIREGCSAELIRTLIDSNNVLYPQPTMVQGPQHIWKERVSVTSIYIPPGIAPGEVLYISNVYYVCNTFQRLLYPLHAPERHVSFMVKPKPVTP